MATYVVRTVKDGSKRVKVMVRRKNAPTATQTFRSRREAEAWAVTVEGALLGGGASAFTEARRHTVAEAMDRYTEVELPRKELRSSDAFAHLAWWKERIGVLLLSQLTSQIICRHRDELASGKTHRGGRRQLGTVNRYVSALGPVLTCAVRDWGWLAQSPMVGVRKFKESRGRVRYLSDDERLALLAAAAQSRDPYIYVILVLALSTGMRRGEIANLRVRDIDWDRKRIILQHTKNGERRAVPLAPKPLELLRELVPANTPVGRPVFPSIRPGREDVPWDFQRAWKAAVKEAGLVDFRFHDLRHSCASYLAMNGATTAEIAEVLGHKSHQMVKRYSHLAHSHVASLIERVTSVIIP